MFNLLGVDRVYSGTQILADIIEQEIDYTACGWSLRSTRRPRRIVEFKLSPKIGGLRQNLQEYTFPGDSKVVMLTRQDGTVEMPRGDLVMQAGDIILLVCDENELTIWRQMVR